MLDKTTFCEVIELIRQQIIFDRRISDTFKEAFGVKEECSYQDNRLVQALMKLLHVHFPKDKDGFCEIQHYCFFIEFGKIGNELMTAEELYDLLNSK